MESKNGSQAPSPAPVYSDALSQAQATGDFSYVIQTARDSDKMLKDFKSAVLMSNFLGRDTRAIAMGLQFLDNMINQSAAQLEQLKRTEKVTREAIKAAQRSKPMSVVGPEDPETAPDVPRDIPPPSTTPEASSEPPAPAVSPEAPPEAPQASAEGGWEVPPHG